ncbi:MAG TPA: lysylphosphatidylglycerol synthase domain-containing protein [Gaiellaceae bacterium]|jgi:Lysylphosphatidylglycerol synthase TM region
MKRALLALGSLAILGVGAYFSRHALGDAVHAIRSADPNWLAVAAAGFIGATAAAAGSWCCAVGLAGGETSLIDGCARYGAGSLVNTFVPFRAGDAVRIALFSRCVPHQRRVRATTGAFAAIGAARAAVLTALVAAGAVAGAIPLWPLAVLVGLVALAAGTAYIARGHDAGHLLDAFKALDAKTAPKLIAWMAASTVCRYFAAAAACASLGIREAFAAAIIILPALDLAGLFPVTPGNVGLTSGAIAVALKAHGIAFDDGLAAGIAFHAVETGVGLLFGIFALVWLAPAITTRTRLTSPT